MSLVVDWRAPYLRAIERILELYSAAELAERLEVAQTACEQVQLGLVAEAALGLESRQPALSADKSVQAVVLQ